MDAGSRSPERKAPKAIHCTTGTAVSIGTKAQERNNPARVGPYSQFDTTSLLGEESRMGLIIPTLDAM